MVVRLDIGSGDSPRAGFTSVDRYCVADIRADMAELPFADDSADEIFSSHALEHVPAEQVGAVLAEWFRVLVPGGRLVLLVPNFDYVAKCWLDGYAREIIDPMIFGLWDGPGQFHRCAFNEKFLREDVERVGFLVEKIEIVVDHRQETLSCTATKPH